METDLFLLLTLGFRLKELLNKRYNMTGELVFFCGKMGAGKSTKAKEIAQEKNAVLLSEDAWLEALYPNLVRSLDSYITYSKLLKPQMKQLVQSILSTGSHVVMDFPANTLSQRAWFKDIYAEIHAPHQLIYLDLSDEACLKQIAQRRIEQPERAETDTVDTFIAVTKFFVAPTEDEGFNLIKVERDID
jgi:predicted kinase